MHHPYSRSSCPSLAHCIYDYGHSLTNPVLGKEKKNPVLKRKAVDRPRWAGYTACPCTLYGYSCIMQVDYIPIRQKKNIARDSTLQKNEEWMNLQ
jgi:hypothetical protein